MKLISWRCRCHRSLHAEAFRINLATPRFRMASKWETIGKLPSRPTSTGKYLNIPFFVRGDATWTTPHQMTYHLFVLASCHSPGWGSKDLVQFGRVSTIVQ